MDYRRLPKTRMGGLAIEVMESHAMGLEALVSKKELVIAFGVSGSFLNKLMAEEDLPYFKIGRAVRFRVSEIAVWLERRRIGKTGRTN